MTSRSEASAPNLLIRAMADPMSYNGAAVIAMTGKNCVAIASDLRFGVNNLFLSRVHKVFPMTKKVYMGFSGLYSDCQTLEELLRFRAKLFAFREGREMSVKNLEALTSALLYEKRFGPYFTEPIIAGLDKQDKPYICGFDLLGCTSPAPDFVCTGTTAEMMMGVAETFWKPDLEPEDLFTAISQTLLSGLDRDALAGWGAVVHVITPDKVITRYLKSRQD